MYHKWPEEMRVCVVASRIGKTEWPKGKEPVRLVLSKTIKNSRVVKKCHLLKDELCLLKNLTD